MNTKGRACYEFPKVEVSRVVLEGFIAASVQMMPATNSFNQYKWDIEADTDSDDIQLLF